MGLLDNTTQQQYYTGDDHGNYQFTSLDDIITQFQIAYVGEDKIISKIKRADIAFYAQRAMQELSFDTFKSCKAQEITVPASLQMTLPQDYVNYTKISWVDSAGIKHLLYPTSKTSNPLPPKQDSNNDFTFNYADELISSTNLIANGDFDDDTGWTLSDGSGTYEAGTPWNIGDINIVQPHLSTSPTHIYKGVAQAGQNSSNYGYMEIDAPDIIEGRTYRITFDLVLAHKTSNFPDNTYTKGNLRLANHTTNASTLNSDNNSNNVELIRSTEPLKAGTYSRDWLQGSSNTGKIKLWNSIPFKGIIDNISVVRVGDGETSSTWSNYKSGTPVENQDDYQDDTYWPMDGERYGLDPQHAQANGSFYIDCNSGKIHFSSNISGKTVVLDYISDGLGTDAEMQVHKFAEEAMYKWIACAILSTRANVPPFQIAMIKKEKFAAVRTAKLRLSNIKLEEITQILRGKSKQIKH